MKLLRVFLILIFSISFFTGDAQDRCDDPFVDTDGDGVCDQIDICPGGDDSIDSDFDEIPDFCDICPYSVNQDCCLDIDVKVFLEGPYDSGTGLMTTGLNNLNILPGKVAVGGTVPITPAGQPYNIPPWNYVGTEGASWSNVDYTPNVVDWILVSVRTSMSGANEVSRAAALLMDDGEIVLAEACILDHGGNDSLHVVIEHRNHIHIMTEEKIPVVNGMVTYDFTTSANPSSGINKQISVGTGLWAMLAGDAIQEGDINGNDKIIWSSDNGIFFNYLPSDFNLDGDVNGSDKILWSGNNGQFTLVPR